MGELIGPDGVRHSLTATGTTLGREGCDVVIPDAQASRRHAEIVCEGGTWVLSDLGSTNGTFVNGYRVQGSRNLQPGDKIRIGAIIMTFGAGLYGPTQVIGGGAAGAGWNEVPPPPAPAPNVAPQWQMPDVAPQWQEPAHAAPQWQPQQNLPAPNPPPAYAPAPAPPPAQAYAAAPPKQRGVALLLEILGGIFGLYGLGWIYADRTGTGIGMLIGGFLFDLLSCSLASVTLGISLVFTIPVQLIVITVSAVLLSNYAKQRTDLFGP